MKKPKEQILVTFYSPSGYENAQIEETSVTVRYLPLDYPQRIKRWVTALQPQCLLLVKYDLWPNLLKATQRHNIPIHVISGRFSPKQRHLKWMQKQLHAITHFWLQNETSANHLEFLGIEQATVVGDSRFDRVYTNVTNQQETSLLYMHLKEKKNC